MSGVTVDRGAATGRGAAPVTPRRGAVARWLVAAVTVTPLLRWLVLVHAVPAGRPWRRDCPRCGAGVSPSAGLAPLLPAARCRGCGRRIGAPPYALEAATLVAAGLVAAAAPDCGVLPALALAGWAAAGVALVFIDLAVHRLPDRLTLPAAGWTLVVLGVEALADGGPWPRALLAALVCGAGFATVTLLVGEAAFGLGDAKLAVSVGALLGWVGWSAVVVGLAIAFLAGGLVAAALLVTRRVGRRDSLAFGPYLVLGTLLAVAWLTPA